MIQNVELMSQGRMTGYICQGFNMMASAPDKAKVFDGLCKLKWLVIVDPLATETSEFWKNFGDYHNAEPGDHRAEVPTAPHADNATRSCPVLGR